MFQNVFIYHRRDILEVRRQVAKPGFNKFINLLVPKDVRDNLAEIDGGATLDYLQQRGIEITIVE